MERKKSIRRYKKLPKRKFAYRAKEKCRQFTAFMFSNVGIILLVVLYMIAGAFMFIAIEGGKALENSFGITRQRDVLASKLWQISCCEANIFNKSIFMEMVTSEISEYQRSIVDAVRNGFPVGNSTDAEAHWTFSASFLYSLTVITTIGYGNISPKSEWGKVVTIFYAIIGMPLFLLYLSNIGDILAKSFKWIYARLCLCRVCPGVARRRAIRERRKTKGNIHDEDWPPDLDLEGAHHEMSEEEMETDNSIDIEIGADTATVTVPLTICLLIMISYILFGALLFGHWDKLTVLDGSYFCFISLSSIGFGDIVPGFQITGDPDTFVELSSAFCALYLLLGMALIAMCFNLMQEQVIHKIGSMKRSIKHCFSCEKKNSEPS